MKTVGANCNNIVEALRKAEQIKHVNTVGLMPASPREMTERLAERVLAIEERLENSLIAGIAKENDIIFLEIPEHTDIETFENLSSMLKDIEEAYNIRFVMLGGGVKISKPRED